MKTRIVCALVALLAASAAFALPARVFVSGSGNDANACSISSPCRSFSAAVAAVASGGEIIPLDSAGYGVVLIDRSVSISAPDGIYAGVTASLAGTDAIDIIAPNVFVNLRGISINNAGATVGIMTGQNGVTLRLDRISIRGFDPYGVGFSSAGGRLEISDSIIRDNALAGIWVESGDPNNFALATLNGVQLNGNYSGSDGQGVVANVNSDVTVRDSVASGNFRGLIVIGGNAQMTVENCAVTDNVVGVFATLAGSTMYVSNSVISHNTLYGIEAQAGTQINSRGNNTVIGNAAAETFSGTFPAK